MAFIRNEEIGFDVGRHVQLHRPVRVPAGEFTKGSILRIIGPPNDKKEFQCLDLDSNETVMLNPKLHYYSRCEDPQDNIDKQVQ